MEKTFGLCCLGSHKSSSYSRKDLNALSTVANELVIAIQNALSVQEVKEFNKTLQQRVDVATAELRSSNDKLKNLDQAKDEFLSMASHQLRTPLTSVKGYISMIIEGDAGKITQAQAKLLTEAFTSSERMVHLINDFLNVSRVQTGKFIIDLHEADLVTIVRQEVSAMQPIAKSRELKIIADISEDSARMNIDEGKIRQVIMNFIDNAVYYSKPGSEITVKLMKTPTVTTVEVHDTGIGVPIAQQKKLFTKFFRADNARLQRPDGTGVGLFLAKKVIDGHHGKIIFKSTEGKGSVFGFSLPTQYTDKTDNADSDK